MRPARATSNDSSDQSDEIKSVSFAGALWESRSFLFFFFNGFRKDGKPHEGKKAVLRLAF